MGSNTKLDKLYGCTRLQHCIAWDGRQRRDVMFKGHAAKSSGIRHEPYRTTTLWSRPDIVCVKLYGILYNSHISLWLKRVVVLKQGCILECCAPASKHRVYALCFNRKVCVCLYIEFGGVESCTHGQVGGGVVDWLGLGNGWSCSPRGLSEEDKREKRRARSKAHNIMFLRVYGWRRRRRGG